MDWSSSWRIQSLQKCLEQSWIIRLSCHRLPYQTCWMDQNAPGSSWLFAGSCQNDRRSEVWWQHRGPFWILFSISILGYWFELFIPSGNLAVLRILTWETDLLFSNLFQIGIEDSLWYTSTVGTLPLVLPSWRWNTVPEFLSRNHFGFSAVLRVPGTRQRGKVPSAEKDCNGITSQMRKKTHVQSCSTVRKRSKIRTELMKMLPWRRPVHGLGPVNWAAKQLMLVYWVSCHITTLTSTSPALKLLCHLCLWDVHLHPFAACAGLCHSWCVDSLSGSGSVFLGAASASGRSSLALGSGSAVCPCFFFSDLLELVYLCLFAVLTAFHPP